MTVIDPVCGMEVDPETAEWKTDYQGQTYYFCAPGCRQAFQKEPEKYVAPGHTAPADDSTSAHPA